MLGLGLDGWNRGWVLARLGEGTEPRVDCIARIEVLDAILAELGSGPRRCLIDIPIGLPLHGERPVDAAAKAALGKAASSVFPIPPRSVFDALDYEEGKQLAQAETGRKISKQTWQIFPKIREVDLWLRRRRPQPAPLRESHPELVFRGLAQMAGVDPQTLGKKASDTGARRRIEVLAKHGVDAEPVLRKFAEAEGPVPKVDDILDALGLAAVARLPDTALATVPETPEIDPLGLPMEMVVPAILLED